jgi:lipopolysaccharide/colanic/teichoic acid biosynthesis glycosyltransferase
VGLDELPQLFNVLRGDMSLVGPRPPLPYEYELYTERHKQRLQVVPGLTGLWQVTAHNLVSFEEMVQLDLDYIDTMSLRLDLQIMLSTPREMLRGKGGG